MARLNRVVAMAMADGPRLGFARLAEAEGLDGFHLLHATRAELLLRCGDRTAAADAFRRALALVLNPVERRHLEGRLAAALR